VGDEVDAGHAYLAASSPAYFAAYQQFSNVVYGRDRSAVPPPVRKLAAIALLEGIRDHPNCAWRIPCGLRDGLTPAKIVQALEITADVAAAAAVVHGARILQEELASAHDATTSGSMV